MITITMSDRFIFERVLNGRFPEKINAKSLFSILVIVILCGSVQKKTMKKITPYCHPLYAKSQICIEIAKIEKLKTWPLSKVIIDQGRVLGNANFDPGKQICDFASRQSFFFYS